MNELINEIKDGFVSIVGGERVVSEMWKVSFQNEKRNISFLIHKTVHMEWGCSIVCACQGGACFKFVYLPVPRCFSTEG